MVALAAVPQRGEPHRLARLDLVHVGLGDLGAHGHYVQPGQHDDSRCGLERVEGLALFGDHSHDDAVHRRDDAGVAQVDAAGLDLGARLFDLRLQRANLRLRRVQCRPGGLVVGARSRIGRQQFLLALEGELRLHQRRSPRGELGLQRVHRRLGVAQRDPLRLGIDFGDQIARLDLLAQFHVQPLDLAGHLGADGDQFLGAQATDGQHRLLQVSHGDGGRGVLDGRPGIGLPQRDACDHAGTDHGTDGPFAIQRHSSSRGGAAPWTKHAAHGSAPDTRSRKSGSAGWRSIGACVEIGWRWSGAASV